MLRLVNHKQTTTNN